jgi:hypothetical protein
MQEFQSFYLTLFDQCFWGLPKHLLETSVQNVQELKCLEFNFWHFQFYAPNQKLSDPHFLEDLLGPPGCSISKYSISKNVLRIEKFEGTLCKIA